MQQLGHRVAGVLVIDRRDFVPNYFAPSYRRGQHLTILGKTGCGKTQLGYDLVDAVASPQLPALNMVIKPEDETVKYYARTLDMPRVRAWPLAPNPFRRKTRGYTVWPPPTFDPDMDDELLYWTHRAVILDSYKRGRRILVADEVVDLAELSTVINGKVHTLKKPLEAVWKRGRSMGCGLWAFTQRPSGMSYHGYSAPEHMFIAYDPDHRTRKRYDEIGGVDSGLVQNVVRQLPEFHFMYLQRSTGTYCVVSA
jgi:hypothetical protein